MLTPTPLPDSSAPPVLPQIPPAGGEAAWERMAAELQAAHQQARATHTALQQLQQADAAGAQTAWTLTAPTLPALPAMGSAVGAAALLLVAALLWRRRTPAQAAVARPDSPITEIPEPDKWYADSVPPPVQDGEEPDPWIPPPPAEVFDLEAATNEVARVRKTLAERRQARARQRADDARQLQELAELAAAAPAPTPETPATPAAQAVVDVERNLPEDAPQPEPGASRPVGLLAEEAPLDALPEEEPPAAPISASASLGLSAADFDSLLEQDYAVTLALAQESEAVDLWGEARELANEVLQSSNPALKSQAHAVLARLDQLESEKALEQRLWGYTP